LDAAVGKGFKNEDVYKALKEAGLHEVYSYRHMQFRASVERARLRGSRIYNNRGSR
jgi:hypothetical protein